MNRTWAVILSLSGLVGAVVGFLGFIVSGNSPDANAAPAQVVKWYADHTNGQNGSTVLLGVAGFLLIVFGAVLYVGLRDDGVSGIASLVGFAGAMLLAVALAIVGGVTLSLTDSPTGVSPITEQALNALSNDVITPLLAIALVAFGAGFGTALIARRRLPIWLGIVGIIFGVANIWQGTPFPVLAVILWIAVVSVWLAVLAWRAPQPAAAVM
jgi:hypothetical protein